MQIAHRVVTQSVVPVWRRLQDINAISAVELIKLVSIADDEINRAPFRTGRALLQKYLHLAKIHTCNRRRFAPGKAQTEAQLCCVKVDSRTNISDGQARMVLLTVDVRGDGRGHEPSFIQAGNDLISRREMI